MKRDLRCAHCRRTFRQRVGTTIHIYFRSQIDWLTGRIEPIDEEWVHFCSMRCHDLALARGRTADGQTFACVR